MPLVTRSKRTAAMPSGVFAVMDAAKQRAKAAGLPLIDLSIGSSDLAPPAAAIAALQASCQDFSSFGYCLHSGSAPFRQAVAQWFKQRFGAEVASTLDPEQMILPLIGAQEGLAHLLLALCDPTDLVLITDPCYPSYLGACAIAGVEHYALPLHAQHGFLPQFAHIPANIAQKAKVLVLNYPNNPTAGVASLAFWQQAVQFCLQHQIVLIHDFPYIDMVFGDYVAPSVFQVPEAWQCAIELYSLSKSYHLGGFRVGWAIGQPDIVASLAQVKSAIDFNMYLGLQNAAIAALSSETSYLRQSANILEQRARVVVHGLQALGWSVQLPQASMYVWAALPTGYPNSFNFALGLAEHTGVCVSPGRAFGERGEGYIRLALVQDVEVLQQAVQKLAHYSAHITNNTL